LFFVAIIYKKTFSPPQTNVLLPQNTKTETKPDIVIEDTQLNVFGFNKISNCTIDADKSNFFQNNQKVMCENARCNIKVKNDTATLTSPTAIVDQKEKTLFLPENVYGTFKNMEFKSDNAFYDSTKQTIAHKNTTLVCENPNLIIKSDNCLLDLKEEKIDLKDNVYSTIKLRNKP
jgi:LPS export ABC transporter protein LptC